MCRGPLGANFEEVVSVVLKSCHPLDRLPATSLSFGNVCDAAHEVQCHAALSQLHGAQAVRSDAEEGFDDDMDVQARLDTCTVSA